MVMITIKENSKQAKAVIAMLRTFSFVEINEETKSPYDPEFVKMIKKSTASKNRTVVNPNDVWGSLGLK
jgi:hypothetical protein